MVKTIFDIIKRQFPTFEILARLTIDIQVKFVLVVTGLNNFIQLH